MFFKKGFTLLELMIAITIIGILTGVVSISYSNIQKASRDSRRKADLKAVQAALEQFFARNGSYPSTNMQFRGLCTHEPYNPGGTMTTTGANGYIPNLAPAFIPFLPRDPRTNQTNTFISSSCVGPTSCYLYRSDGVEYKFMTYCTPETRIDPNDPLRDPRRPAFGYAVYTPNAANW